MKLLQESDHDRHDAALERLVAEHLGGDKSGLLAAVSFDPGKDDGCFNLFGIIGDFGNGGIDPDREFFPWGDSHSERGVSI